MQCHFALAQSNLTFLFIFILTTALTPLTSFTFRRPVLVQLVLAATACAVAASSGAASAHIHDRTCMKTLVDMREACTCD